MTPPYSWILPVLFGKCQLSKAWKKSMDWCIYSLKKMPQIPCCHFLGQKNQKQTTKNSQFLHYFLINRKIALFLMKMVLCCHVEIFYVPFDFWPPWSQRPCQLNSLCVKICVYLTGLPNRGSEGRAQTFCFQWKIAIDLYPTKIRSKTTLRHKLLV